MTKIEKFKHWLYELDEQELCAGREKIMEFVKELLSEMVVEEDSIKPTIYARSDIGAGYIIGKNAAREEQLKKLNQLIK